VIKSFQALEVFFFSYALLKMDRFLLNSNKRCESENKEGTSSTSGKRVKKRKHRKYNDSYLDFGFMSTEVDGDVRKFWHQSACYQVS
jgi:hypothetical protein